MPILDTPEQLLAALGKSPFSTDPLADLAREGYTLSPELTRQWHLALEDKKLALPPPGVTPVSFPGTLTFQQPPVITTQAQPAPGNYDVLAGLTFAVANTAIDAVYQSGTIPHEIALDQLLSATELEALADFFKVDRPGGQPTRLQITSAPTLAGTTDSNSVVALLIPIELDWIEILNFQGTQIQKLITQATGTLQLTMTPVAKVALLPDPTMTIGVQLLDASASSTADSPRLTLDPDSPVQLKDPAPPNQIDGTAAIIQNALAERFGGSLNVSVSGAFNLGTGSLVLDHADIVSKGGMLLAGLQMVGTGTTGATDPSQLVSLLPSGANLYLKVQGSVVNALLQDALQSGQLTAQAQQKQNNAFIDSASATFQNNQLVVQVGGYLYDECPGGVNLYFTDTRTVSLNLLNGGSLEISQSDNLSIDEASNVWCLLATLGLVAFAAILPAVMVNWLIGFAGFLLFSEGIFGLAELVAGQAGGTIVNIVNLTQPIPDSNFLPTLTGGDFQMSDGGLLIATTAGTQPDTINAIIYVRFLAPAGGIEAGATKPLAGAKVELMAQDVPPPPGASQVPPGSSSGLGKHRVTVSYTYIPPTSDQQLAVGQTDFNGEVRFGLLASQLVTQTGEIKEERTSFDPDADRFITIPTLTPVMVAKPDLYFRVTMPDGSVADTRQLPGGLLVSSVSSQVGTLANPLTLSLGGVLVIGNQGATTV